VGAACGCLGFLCGQPGFHHELCRAVLDVLPVDHQVVLQRRETSFKYGLQPKQNYREKRAYVQVQLIVISCKYFVLVILLYTL